MARNIFWSWQSDAPQRETRGVIHEALKRAVKELEVELQEAERFEIDQGARGVLGMELIAEKILDKIDLAAIFVGDISTVGVIGEENERKCIANPNVMLELGYARRALGRQRVIPVFNKAIGPTRHEDLPFDLRHMSGSIHFELPVGATNEDLVKERNKLQRHFREYLSAMLANLEVGSPPPPSEWHLHLPHDPSIWEEAYNLLPVACPSLGQVDLIIASAPRFFVRLLPATHRELRKVPDCLFPGKQEALYPIGTGGNLNYGRSGNGYVIFESISEGRTTQSAARWYKDNGEIWAISALSFYKRGERPHLAYDEAIKDLVRWLGEAVLSSRAAGGRGPHRLILGCCGLRGVEWWVSRSSLSSRPYLGLNDYAIHECTLEDDSRSGILDAVHSFMEVLTENFGVKGLSLDQVTKIADG